MIGDIIGVPGAPSTIDAKDIQRLMDQRDQARAERDLYKAALIRIAGEHDFAGRYIRGIATDALADVP